MKKTESTCVVNSVRSPLARGRIVGHLMRIIEVRWSVARAALGGVERSSYRPCSKNIKCLIETAIIFFDRFGREKWPQGTKLLLRCSPPQCIAIKVPNTHRDCECAGLILCIHFGYSRSLSEDRFAFQDCSFMGLSKTATKRESSVRFESRALQFPE